MTIIYCNETNDITEIVNELKINKTILFSFYPNEYTAHNILLSIKYKTLGSLSFGSNPKGLLVGIMRKGFFWFNLNNEVFSDYINEKFNMADSDSIEITKMINAVIKEIKND